jgi:hypothetical protein
VQIERGTAMTQRHEQGVPIRGVAPGRGAKRAPTYAGNRTCGDEGCTTRLSIYNRAERCWLHEPPQKYVVHTGGRPRKARHVAA